MHHGLYRFIVLVLRNPPINGKKIAIRLKEKRKAAAVSDTHSYRFDSDEDQTRMPKTTIKSREAGTRQGTLG